MLNWTRKRRYSRPAAAPRARLRVEGLEERAVPAGPPLPPPVDPGAGLATVFTESNNPAPGQNAVLAFSRGADGTLTQIGTFLTHGTGQLNLPKVVGPDDSSQEVVATPDGRFLFAVNQGSNTVAAFRILGDGRLHFIGTVDSGGVQPDSLGIVGDNLYVSNRGDAANAGPGGVPAANPGTVAPNITAFTIDPNGSLDPVANSTVTLPQGTVPSQNLISRDGRFLFSDIFGVNGGTAPQSNTLAPFQIQSDGTLTLAPGGNVAAQAPGATTPPPALLGADVNPHLNIVYAGLTGLSEVAVFTYDDTGRLSFVGASAPNADGGSGPCWVAVSPDGKFLYTGDTGSDSVGVYSLANPQHPVQLQELFLGGPLTPPGSPPGTPRQTTAFQVAVDPSGRFVYAISQNTSPNGTFQEGNQLHILSVARDGTLSEPNGPTILPPGAVPGTAHPQGIAVVGGVGRSDGGGHHRGGPDSDATKTAGDRSDSFFHSLGSSSLDLSEVVDLLTRHRD
jgi:6-phosphogluconolactonase (cycloisomerase 2 family)